MIGLAISALRIGATFLYKHAFGLAVTAAVANKASDNKIAEAALSAGDATVGPDNMKKAGQAIHKATTYVGEGFVGAGETIGKHYGTDPVAVVPAQAAVKFAAIGVAVASTEVDVVHRAGIKAPFELAPVFGNQVTPVASQMAPDPVAVPKPATALQVK